MKNVLVITKGHPFEREPFFSIFDDMEGVAWTHVEHPAAPAVFDPHYASAFDAFVFYDMPGVQFGANGPRFPDPPERLVEDLETLTGHGMGLVFLHHAIAGWPSWPDYGRMIGGRFYYVPTDGCQDSGYRHGLTHNVSVLREHPVTKGLPPRFTMTDELYLGEVNEADVTPLLASDYDFEEENFYSAAKVVLEGKMFDNDGWTHRSGSNLVGWAREQDKSRIVYLQGGDDPVAYANEHYRQLIANAIDWVSS